MCQVHFLIIIPHPEFILTHPAFILVEAEAGGRLDKGGKDDDKNIVVPKKEDNIGATQLDSQSNGPC